MHLYGCAEHIWPVSVEGIDGKSVLVTPGSYRLCLTATNLTLVPLWSSTQPEVVIPESIRLFLHYVVTDDSF